MMAPRLYWSPPWSGSRRIPYDGPAGYLVGRQAGSMLRMVLYPAGEGIWRIAAHPLAPAPVDYCAVSVPLLRALEVAQHYADNGDWPADLLVISPQDDPEPSAGDWRADPDWVAPDAAGDTPR